MILTFYFTPFISIINLTIVECKLKDEVISLVESKDNKSNHSGM